MSAVVKKWVFLLVCVCLGLAWGACSKASLSKQPPVGGLFCSSDTDCASGHRCVELTCVRTGGTQEQVAADGGGTDQGGPRCTAAEICGDGLDNDCNGSVDDGCAACEPACTDGQSCVDGRCVAPECQSNFSCSGGQICAAGRCVPCQTDEQCGAGRLCLPNGCRLGNCRLNSDCSGGRVCRDNVCRSCDSDAQCGGGTRCQDGRCRAGGCQNASDCPQGQVCRGGQCGPCQDNGDCDNGRVCLDGGCIIPECQEDRQCGQNRSCERFRCVARGGCQQDGDCNDGQRCVDGSCVAQSGGCQRNADCSDGLVCKGGACTKCANNNDCGSGRACDPQQGVCRVGLRTSNNASLWADQTYATSCLGYRKPASALYIPATRSGAYWIRPAGVNQAFRVYCGMEAEGGGWTLVLKADGNRNTFRYDAGTWTSQQTFNTSSVSASRSEAKFASYHTVGFQELLIVLVFPNDPNPYRVVLGKQASSLHAVMQTNRYVAFDKGIGRDGWRNLMRRRGALQRNCNREGFNNRSGNDSSYARVRIGIIANNQNDCNSPDSRIGVGASGSSCNQSNSVTVGNATGVATGQGACGPIDGGTRNEAAFAYVFVR